MLPPLEIAALRALLLVAFSFARRRVRLCGVFPARVGCVLVCPSGSTQWTPAQTISSSRRTNTDFEFASDFLFMEWDKNAVKDHRFIETPKEIFHVALVFQ